MGNPSNAQADVLQFNNYLMEKPAYSLSYNRDKGTPNWVSWHLEAIGSVTWLASIRSERIQQSLLIGIAFNLQIIFQAGSIRSHDSKWRSRQSESNTRQSGNLLDD
jgi:hypothetical protein